MSNELLGPDSAGFESFELEQPGRGLELDMSAFPENYAGATSLNVGLSSYDISMAGLDGSGVGIDQATIDFALANGISLSFGWNKGEFTNDVDHPDDHQGFDAQEGIDSGSEEQVLVDQDMYPDQPAPLPQEVPLPSDAKPEIRFRVDPSGNYRANRTV